MGRKKRIEVPRSKPLTAAVGDAADDGFPIPDQAAPEAHSNPDASDLETNSNATLSSYASVKLECQRAFIALRRGNYTKALRLMKDLCTKYDTSPSHLALINRVQATLCLKVAAIMDDPNSKQRCLRNAFDSAKKAVVLSPSSIEFAHFYANMLYEAANDDKDYAEVMRECDRALAIENPVDPAKESLQDENQQRVSTDEARIIHFQDEIRAITHKINFPSISSLVKNLGNGEETFQLIPIRRVLEDPMELKTVHVRRPNEIKKVVKTFEERRKEIEVRVAAARLLQQKSESNPLKNDNNSQGLDNSAPGLGPRASERRKIGNSRRAAFLDERRDLVRPYWNSMSSNEQKDLLRIKLLDLREHFTSSKDRAPCKVLNEALSYGKLNKLWRFWTCCRCSENFTDANSFMQHVVQEHMRTLLPKFQSILPQNVENEWAEMLLHCSWKPFDLNAAIGMLERQPKSNKTLHVESRINPRHDIYDTRECYIDTYCCEYEWDSLSQRKRSGDNCNGRVEDNREFEDVEWMDCDGDQSTKETLHNENWPVSADLERAKLLERIHASFQSLIKHKCLASSHLSKVIHFAVEEIQAIACDSQLNSMIDQSPSCICFLGAQELQKILKFLHEISQSCGLNQCDNKSNTGDESNNRKQGIDATQKIDISDDASVLVLDEHFLQCIFVSISVDGGVSDASSCKTTCCGSYENGVVLDSDSLLSWIFTGMSTGEQLAAWKHAKEEKARQGLEIFLMLEKEYDHLQGLCEKKCNNLSYEEALQSVEDLCLEEGKKGEHVGGFPRRSYDSILKGRREELEVGPRNAVSNNKIELDAISNVMNDVKSLNGNQFGSADTYRGVKSHLCDLESGEEYDWRTKDYLHQVDSCVEVAIHRQKEQVSVEISKIDARIMRVLAEMQRLEVKLEAASFLDFRLILIPLVKSFIRARLEDRVEKEAAEKSDAAREAFLAELAQDSKKGGVSARVDSSKHLQDKTKDRKKSKDTRKNKESKAANDDELHDQTAKDIAHDEDGPDFGIVIQGPVDSSQLEEEEHRRISELEAEERKLEETLEYQRRIENEAKQKHLAEQHKKNLRINGKAETVAVHDSYPRHCNDDKYTNHQLADKKDSMVHKDGFPYIVEGPKNIANGDILKIDLPKRGILENDGFVNRHTGKRGRRHNGPTKVDDEKFFPVTPDREDGDPGQPRLEQYCHDNGAKTLGKLQAEDDEERFQADLKKAVHQSLVLTDGANGIDTYGTGLKNEVGEYNCFLNVIIQSLWNLRRLRDDFLRRTSSGHVHVGDPCVICALYDIFVALSMVSKDNIREPVAPTSLRFALSNLYPDSKFFQEGEMNDASEVMGVIFNCLHRSFLVASGADPVDSNCTGTWDCNGDSCIAHSVFGMNIFERMNCYSCGLESRYLKYSSFFHNINASALRTMKVMYPENSFEELLNMVEMNHQLACDTEAGGCGKFNYIHHILSTPPHVFTIVLGWQNTSESIEDIMATLAALSPEIDISILYRGIDPQNRHCLVSVVCYYGQHYHCFAYSREHEQWIMYDDKTVKVIGGGWSDVLTICERGHLQPQLLLYEAVY